MADFPQSWGVHDGATSGAKPSGAAQAGRSPLPRRPAGRDAGVMTAQRAPMLSFLGAAGTVTGSRFVIDTATGRRLLIDCGMYQGLKELRERNWRPFGVGPASIDSVLLTHAHVDHCGFLPALVRDGFRGPVFCTDDTAALAAIVLPDSGRLAEEEARYAARRGYSRHDPVLPLFTEADALAALERLRPIPFGEHHDQGDVVFRFGRAGHILGSAWVHLTLESSGRSITFTGDLGRPSHPLLAPPEPRPASDVVVCESTYGDREHELVDPANELDVAIRRTVERGGTAIIPAFAVDRTDVVLHHLRRLRDHGRLPEVPIYVDSPMAAAALSVYRAAFDPQRPAADVRAELVGTHPMSFDGLHVITTVEESKRLNDLDRPAVIISASGMLTGGRVMHHLARRIDDARNTVILIGYQAEATRGRRLLEGATSLKMLGRYWPVRAELVHIASMSVHADRSELIGWLGSGEGEPDVTYVVHGEPDSSAGLVSAIESRLGWMAAAPRLDERVRLD